MSGLVADLGPCVRCGHVLLGLDVFVTHHACTVLISNVYINSIVSPPKRDMLVGLKVLVLHLTLHLPNCVVAARQMAWL